MEQHVKILAILNIVLGALGACSALIILVFFGGLAGIVQADPDPEANIGAAVLALIGGIGAVIVAVLSVPLLIVGFGLLNYREWALILGIIVSILNLIHIPLGTLVGAYGLWVLLNDDTKRLFRIRSAAPAGQRTAFP